MSEYLKLNKPKILQISTWQLNLVVSLFLLIAFNNAFWSEIIKVIQPNEINEYLLITSIFLLVLIILNLFLNLLCSKYTYKYIYPIVLIGSALSLYFIKQYNIIIDRDMIQNVIETNPAEATDFFNLTLIFYLVVFGIIPSLLILKSNIHFNKFVSELFLKLKVALISFILIGLLLYISYPAYASIARSNRHLSHLIVPTNFIFASLSYINQQFKSAKMPLDRISLDAKLDSTWRAINSSQKSVLVLVIGETARADRFGINGYSKNTTPNLTTRDLFNFSQVSSCGTSTAISLPCLFSHLDRENFSKTKANNTENLLDFLAHAGYSVQWRDNNTGCKGICERVDFLDLTHVENDPKCETGECFDEVLLNNLSSQIENNPNNQVIIIHQKGSHGPAYYLRYPKQFEKFNPICTTNELQKCSQESISNTYDNTILYTDFVVDKVISTLESLPQGYSTSMLYISDHGESLGENNIYLHGTPYFMAPDTQTHIPLFIWLSENYKNNFGVNQECLKLKQDYNYSHDNFFHSVLGMLKVTSQYYDPNKDIFNSCFNKLESETNPSFKTPEELE
jgi:lipid A ethanolaminephosphotransferase